MLFLPEYAQDFLGTAMCSMGFLPLGKGQRMLNSRLAEVSCPVAGPMRIWRGLGQGRWQMGAPDPDSCLVPALSPADFSMMTPINDLHTADSLNLAKGERLMRCKISSVYRLLDLYGWAQLSDTYVTVRTASWSGVEYCVCGPHKIQRENS